MILPLIKKATDATDTLLYSHSVTIHGVKVVEVCFTLLLSSFWTSL